MQTNNLFCLLVNKKINLHLSNITFNSINAYSHNLAKDDIPTLLLTSRGPGENAAMIAMIDLEKFKSKKLSEQDHSAKPRWPLDENTLFLKGAGVKL